jgi:hypothetical protein
VRPPSVFDSATLAATTGRAWVRAVLSAICALSLSASWRALSRSLSSVDTRPAASSSWARRPSSIWGMRDSSVGVEVVLPPAGSTGTYRVSMRTSTGSPVRVTAPSVSE